MFDLTVTPFALAIRAIVVYAALLLLLRIGGKRQVGQLAPFDLVLLLVISNAVQNSMNGGDNSLVGGLISAGVLVVVHFAVSMATLRSRRIERMLDGEPEVLIRNGTLYPKVLKRAQLTQHELLAALRQHGCSRVQDAELVILEVNGAISVLPQKTADAKPPL